MTWECAQSALWKRSPSHVPDRAHQHTKTQKNNVTVSNGTGSLKSPIRMSLTQLVKMKVCYFQIKGDRQQDETTASTAEWALVPLCTISPTTDICERVQPRERASVLTSQQFTQTSAFITAQTSSPHRCGLLISTPDSFLSSFTFNKRMLRVWAERAQLS